MMTCIDVLRGKCNSSRRRSHAFEMDSAPFAPHVALKFLRSYCLCIQETM